MSRLIIIMKNILSSAIHKLSTAYNHVHTYFNPQPQPLQDKLLKQIEACCYQKQNIMLIHDAIDKTIKQYPELETGVLTFGQDGTEKSLIELQGNIPVIYKNNTYPVKCKVYVPQEYPRQAPMIRIINVDPNNLRINPLYQDGRSSNDYNSYVLIQLETFRNWNPDLFDICTLIAETQSILSKNFPFGRKLSKAKNPSQSKKQPQQQSKLLSNGKEQPNSTLKQIKNYQDQCKKLVQQLLSTVPKVQDENLNKVQKLQSINYILSCQVPRLKQSIRQIQEFIQEKQGMFQHMSLLQAVYTQGKQQLLLELVTQNKALECSLQFLDKKFTSGDIDFQSYLKMVRRVQEKRFVVRYNLRFVMSGELS